MHESETNILRKAGINTQYLEKDNADNLVVRDKEEMLDAIGAFLESIHAYTEFDENNNNQKLVYESFQNFLHEKALFEDNQTTYIKFSKDLHADKLSEEQAGEFFITTEKLCYIFASLRNKVSSGWDNIPNSILRKLPGPMINNFCILFNNMLNNAYFPKIWKTAKVVIIPKKDKDPSYPQNIRPISLLPNISKVFEICINNIINSFMSQNLIVSEKQFGFKYKHSTTNAISLLTSNINWNWNKGLCTGACFIDMEKAFDKVWIPGLIAKLIAYNFPINRVILIYNMINDRQFVISHMGRKS